MSERFLSTLSLRRATWLELFLYYQDNNFYPRSPCGERRRRSVKLFRQNYISIHALLAESDAVFAVALSPASQFLSTLSLRRATQLPATEPPRVVRFLSTLSLRRATLTHDARKIIQNYFYPRSPCGERLDKRCEFNRHNGFLSTLSLRRATPPNNLIIHRKENFYPRSPCGERPPPLI